MDILIEPKKFVDACLNAFDGNIDKAREEFIKNTLSKTNGWGFIPGNWKMDVLGEFGKREKEE